MALKQLVLQSLHKLTAMSSNRKTLKGGKPDTNGLQVEEKESTFFPTIVH